MELFELLDGEAPDDIVVKYAGVASAGNGMAFLMYHAAASGGAPGEGEGDAVAIDGLDISAGRGLLDHDAAGSLWTSPIEPSDIPGPNRSPPASVKSLTSTLRSMMVSNGCPPRYSVG